MPETLNRKHKNKSILLRKERRVIFPKGEQRQFLLKAKKKSKLSWVLLAKKVNVHQRTINSWKREEYSMSLLALNKLCQIAHLKSPLSIEIRDRYWYTKIGGKIAGKLVYQKYGTVGGDPETRKRKWLAWWKKIGRFQLSSYFLAKKIRKPQKNSRLAEFAGIMIGDGGITKRQVTVTLNCKTDKKYIAFVESLFKRLFGVNPALYKRERESVINIVVSRTKLVSLCRSIGLKVGNKLAQNLDIPEWIKENERFSKACIRGLVDTDGCIFEECHNIKNRRYCYPRLSLVSASQQLRFSVFTILKRLGFTPVIRNNRSVQLESLREIRKYFKIIGTNNYKHQKRFRQMTSGRVG